MSSHVDATALDRSGETAVTLVLHAPASSSRSGRDCVSNDKEHNHKDSTGNVTLLGSNEQNSLFDVLSHGTTTRHTCTDPGNNNNTNNPNDKSTREMDEEWPGMLCGSPIRQHSRLVTTIISSSNADVVHRKAHDTHDDANQGAGVSCDALPDSRTVSFVIDDEEESMNSDHGEFDEETAHYLHEGHSAHGRSNSSTSNTRKNDNNGDNTNTNKNNDSNKDDNNDDDADASNNGDEEDDEEDETNGRGSPMPVTLLGAARDLRRKRIKRVSNYILGPLLGEGACGVVRDAIDISGERGAFRRCAVKIVSLPRLRGADAFPFPPQRTNTNTNTLTTVNATSSAGLSHSTREDNRAGHALVPLHLCPSPTSTSAPAGTRIQHYPSEQARQVAMFRNEIKNLQRFHCRYLIRAEDIFSRYGKEYVVMPFAVCTLAQLVRVSRNLRKEQTREAAEERARQHRLRLRHELECAQQQQQQQQQQYRNIASNTTASMHSYPTRATAGANDTELVVSALSYSVAADGAHERSGHDSAVWLEVASSPPTLTRGVFGRSEHCTSSATPTIPSSPMTTQLPDTCAAGGAADLTALQDSVQADTNVHSEQVQRSSRAQDKVCVQCDCYPAQIQTTTNSLGNTNNNDNNTNVCTHESPYSCANSTSRTGDAEAAAAPSIMTPLLAPTLIKDLMFQILSGLAYLHKQNIAHNDVKLENTLLFEEGNVALCDLGSVGEHYADQGTPLYASPELCRVFYGMGSSSDNKEHAESASEEHDKAASKSATVAVVDAKAYDMWCCGIILYALITGLPGPLPVHQQRRKLHAARRRAGSTTHNNNNNSSSNNDGNNNEHEVVGGPEGGVDLEEPQWYTRFQLYRIIADCTAPVNLSQVPDLIDGEVGNEAHHDDATTPTTTNNINSSSGYNNNNSIVTKDDNVNRYSEKSVRHLLAWLLSMNPAHRCTVEQALQHPWLTPSFRSCRRQALSTRPVSAPSSCSSSPPHPPQPLMTEEEAINERVLLRQAMEDAIARDVARRVLHSPQFKAIIREDRVSHLQFVADCCHILRIHLPREIVREPTAEPYEYDEEESRVARQRHHRVTRRGRYNRLYRLMEGNGACGPRHRKRQQQQQQHQQQQLSHMHEQQQTQHAHRGESTGQRRLAPVSESALQGVQDGVVVMDDEPDDDDEGDDEDDYNAQDSEYAMRYAEEEELDDECEYVDYTGDERARRYMPAVLPHGCVDPLLFLPFSEENYYYLKGARAEFDVRNLVHSPQKVLQLREYLFNTVLVQCGYRTRLDPRYTVARRGESGHERGSRSNSSNSNSSSSKGHSRSGGIPTLDSMRNNSTHSSSSNNNNKSHARDVSAAVGDVVIRVHGNSSRGEDAGNNSSSNSNSSDSSRGMSVNTPAASRESGSGVTTVLSSAHVRSGATHATALDGARKKAVITAAVRVGAVVVEVVVVVVPAATAR